jgi:hypothetical protein
MSARTFEDQFYSAVSLVLMILTAPIWIPLGLYIGMTYHWTDTVPKEEGDE